MIFAPWTYSDKSRDMLIGYASVFTDDPYLRLQRAALKAAGCTRIFEETASGPTQVRSRARVLDQVRNGDVLVVVRLERLVRSTRDLLDIARRLDRIGVGLRSLTEPWADTTSPLGPIVLTVLDGIAEFERGLIQQRGKSGRLTAKARGVRLGRPPKLTADQITLGKQLLKKNTSVRDTAKLLECHPATLYRALNQWKKNP